MVKDTRRIHVDEDAMIGVPMIEVAVTPPLIIIGPPRKIVAAEIVRPLHKPRPPSFVDDPAVVGVLDEDSAASIESVVNIHVPSRVVKITRPAVGAHADGVA